MGPHNPASISRKNHIVLLLNEFTWKFWIFFLRSKDKFFDVFKLWLPRVEASGNRLDYLRADDGGEFISAILQSFCQEKGIKIGYTAPYIYEENNIAEQCWKTLAQMKDSLLINSGLPTQFWAEAMDIANYLQNWLPIRRTDKAVIILEETWTKVKQDLSHIQIFGSKVSTHILSKKRSKSDVYKTWNRIFIGYTNITKYLRVWVPKSYQVLIAKEPIVNKLKWKSKLLVNNPMLASARPLRQYAGKPRPQRRLKKRA